MTDRCVEIVAPSRLHFGLFSTGGEFGRRFGGVGAMIEQPEIRLRIEPAERFTAVGPLADRVRGFAETWSAFHRLEMLPSSRIEVLRVPPQHSGLGVGTQLGLSVATGLTIGCGLPLPSPVELAISVGRGRRSAVGTYGFAEGGLIIERGKLPGEPLAPLDTRLDLPAAWRFVLLRPRDASGLCGRAEQAAFANLPPMPMVATEALIREVRERMVPAAALGDFDSFSESVYQFGRRAGEAFAAVQGGPYNGPRLAALVDAVRACGVVGVGQSSWGPTLFAILPSQDAAADFSEQFKKNASGGDVELSVTPVSNRGVRVTGSGVEFDQGGRSPP